MGRRTVSATQAELEALKSFLSPEHPVSARYCLYRLLLLQPGLLAQRLDSEIRQHVDWNIWRETEAKQEHEREILRKAA